VEASEEKRRKVAASKKKTHEEKVAAEKWRQAAAEATKLGDRHALRAWRAECPELRALWDGGEVGPPR
jgi:hypothetical protein